MKFVRRDSGRFSKLGKKRKKLQKWRGAKGRDNKIRENRRGYPKAPAVGYAKAKKESGKVRGMIPVEVSNVRDLEKVGKENIVVIKSVGARKKMEVIKKAEEKGIKVFNLGGKK